MNGSSNEINTDYKQTFDWKKRVNFWVLDLLQVKNIIIWDNTDSKTFEINKDQMSEYLNYIENNIEICKQELLTMDFLN